MRIEIRPMSLRRSLRAPSRAALAVAVALGAAAGACGTEPGGDDNASEVTSTEGSILNGTAVSDALTSAVALEYWNMRTLTWRTFCAGALMTNGAAITAKHCLDDLFPFPEYGGVMRVRMGTQRSTIYGYARHPSADVDVAMVWFQNIVMWNWVIDRFATVLPQQDVTSYRRKVHQSSDSALNGTSLTCYGYGGGGELTPLKKATWRTTFADGLQPLKSLHLQYDGMPAEVQPGDSGMGCVLNGNNLFFAGTLAGVAWYTYPALMGVAEGAERWRAWSKSLLGF